MEATKDGIFRVALIEVAEAIRVAYRTLLISIANNNLQWIYGADGDVDSRAEMPAFTRDELGNVVDMHTLKQQLEVWDAVNAYYVKNGRAPFESIQSILPSLIAAWNSSKGGVDVMSRYLANVHRSPFKQIEGFEFRLWDRLILLAYLQAFHAERWSAVGINKIDDAKSVEALFDLGHQGERTFSGFLRTALRYLSRSISQTEPEEEAVEMEVEMQPYEGTKGVKLQNFFNEDSGRNLRSSNLHHSMKITTKRICSLCHGRPHPNSTKPKKTSHKCIQCGVYLCVVVKQHPYDVVQPPVEGQLVSCWNLWHNSPYTIPCLRGDDVVLAGGEYNDDLIYDDADDEVQEEPPQEEPQPDEEPHQEEAPQEEAPTTGGKKQKKRKTTSKKQVRKSSRRRK